MDLLEIYNTPENHEKAKKLLEKHLDPAVQYSKAFLEYFANVFICALCDLMSDDFEWYVT
ncbi:MAG: hypothetical protein LUD51_05740 [Clostridia bacterium]|nr:hypothetical protein [Clostridia bacterium]